MIMSGLKVIFKRRSGDWRKLCLWITVWSYALCYSLLKITAIIVMERNIECIWLNLNIFLFFRREEMFLHDCNKVNIFVELTLKYDVIYMSTFDFLYYWKISFFQVDISFDLLFLFEVIFFQLIIFIYCLTEISNIFLTMF